MPIATSPGPRRHGRHDLEVRVAVGVGGQTEPHELQLRVQTGMRITHPIDVDPARLGDRFRRDFHHSRVQGPSGVLHGCLVGLEHLLAQIGDAVLNVMLR